MDNYSMRQAPMAPMQRLNTARGSGSQFYLAGNLDRVGSELTLGIDGIAAEHESVITNPNNAMFRIDNFSAVSRDLLGVFVEWSGAMGQGQVEFGLRSNRVRTHAGTVAASGMMGMMGTNAQALSDAFNSAQRKQDWQTLDSVIKYRQSFSTSAEWSIEVGSKSRAPSYQELYLWLPMQATGGLADGRTYIGNLDLKQERSKELVVGVSAVTGRFAWSPQMYYRKVDDYIQGVPSTNMVANMMAGMMTGKQPLQFANVDADIWGLDAAWSYELSENLLVDGIVSIARGRRDDVDDDLYRLPPFNTSLGLTYRADSWSIKSEVIAYADQDKIAILNEETETSGYWLVNLGAVWSPSATFRVEARVDNLLDESYQDHVTGINRAGGSEIPVGVRLYGAERTISAGLIYSF
jgi:iron complex outermembrane receptor protein